MYCTVKNKVFYFENQRPCVLLKELHTCDFVTFQCPEGSWNKCICAKPGVKARVTMKMRLFWRLEHQAIFSSKTISFKMNVSKACIWPSMCCIISLLANSPWLRPTNCEFGKSKPLAQSHVCETVSFYLPKQRMQSFGDISLPVWSLQNIPALPNHFSEQTIYCCLLDPVNLNDPCDSLKETLQLKWGIVFHGLCPNDWWHFWRHLQRRPPANLKRHLNTKILPRHKESNILTTMLQISKVFIVAWSNRKKE